MQVDTAAVAARPAPTASAAGTGTAPTAESFSLTGAFDGLLDKLVGWAQGFILALPNLLIAVLIVVVAVVLARVARRVVMGLMSRVSDRASHTRNAVDLLATLAYVAVLAAGTFIALGVLQLTGVVTTLLAGAGVVGLALGFAFQDIASNFIAGVLMAVRTPFIVGQIIETNGFTGTVVEITLRSTILDTFQGQRVILPNAKVYGDPIVNYSARQERRIDLGCGVGYGDDLGHAQRVAVKAVEGLPMRKPDRPVQLYYAEFGDSSINFTVRFWVDFGKQTDFLEAQSEAVKAIKAAFDASGVTIPFPIRTLDFDPSGGVRLADQLRQRADGEAG